MPLILVAGAKIQCTHAGIAAIPSGDERLTIGGNGAVTAGMEAGISFAPGSPGVLTPCPFTDPKSDSPAPCRGTQAATAGKSGILSVGGAAVLLPPTRTAASSPHSNTPMRSPR